MLYLNLAGKFAGKLDIRYVPRFLPKHSCDPHIYELGLSATIILDSGTSC